MTTVVLVAHGSRDPRSAVTVRALARAVTVLRPDDEVRAAFLEFDTPSLAGVLADVRAEGTRAVVVPLLLTPAYHARVDIPTVVAASGADADITDVIGASGTDLLVAGLHRRLAQAAGGYAPVTALDGVVLAAAGSRAPRALAAVDGIAEAFGDSLGVACLAGYASGAGRTVTEAHAALRAHGARRIGVASHFLAPGVLHDRAMAMAGSQALITAPLGNAPEIADLVARAIADAALAPIPA